MRVTRRSMSSRGMLNSSSMQSGMAPPQGLATEGGLRSKRKVSTPPAARASAAEEPAGPPPITAARSLRPAMDGRLDLEAEIVKEWKQGLDLELGFLVESEGKKVVWRR